MKLLTYFIIAIIGFVFAMLGLLNSANVSFNYILGKADIPLIAVMFLSFFVGAVLTLLIFGTKAMFWRARAKRLLSNIEREQQEAKKAAIQADFHADNAV